MAADEERGETPDAETPPELSERRFAENLRTAREDNGVSQVKLAQEMALRGWPWRQQTVTRVESGQRMVRLGEALAVAEILGTNLMYLTASTRETTAVTLLAGSTSTAKRAFGQIAQWTQTLLSAQRQLRTAVAEVTRDGYLDSSLVRNVAGKAAELLEVTPEQAVAEGRTEDEDLRSSIAEYNERARMVADVVRAYVDEGGTIRTIAQLHPLSERQVRDILEGQGVEIRRRRKGDAPATPTVDLLAARIDSNI